MEYYFFLYSYTKNNKHNHETNKNYNPINFFSLWTWRVVFKGYLHDDVVDGDVDEFDEETDESHNGKPNSCGHGDLLKL